MVKVKSLLFTSLFGVTFMLLAFQQKKITVFMAGDSTMSIKKEEKRPETGWGMPFAQMFNDNIIIENKAANGRSTRTFISEGKWQEIIEKVKEGDYVFIQFGHNDESKEKVDRYTSPDDYKINLIKFVQEVKAKQGIPILLTPIVRRRFDKEGKFYDVHGEYPAKVREVALEQNTLLIDMQQKTEKALSGMGKQESIKWFLHLDSAQHINYPKGVKDDTHLNEYGAAQVAEMVKLALLEQKIPLAKYLKK